MAKLNILVPTWNADHSLWIVFQNWGMIWSFCLSFKASIGLQSGGWISESKNWKQNCFYTLLVSWNCEQFDQLKLRYVKASDWNNAQEGLYAITINLRTVESVQAHQGAIRHQKSYFIDQAIELWIMLKASFDNCHVQLVWFVNTSRVRAIAKERFKLVHKAHVLFYNLL